MSTLSPNKKNLTNIWCTSSTVELCHTETTVLFTWCGCRILANNRLSIFLYAFRYAYIRTFFYYPATGNSVFDNVKLLYSAQGESRKTHGCIASFSQTNSWTSTVPQMKVIYKQNVVIDHYLKSEIRNAQRHSAPLPYSMHSSIIDMSKTLFIKKTCTQ